MVIIAGGEDDGAVEAAAGSRVCRTVESINTNDPAFVHNGSCYAFYTRADVTTQT
jgi:hypothetical protein